MVNFFFNSKIWLEIIRTILIYNFFFIFRIYSFNKAKSCWFWKSIFWQRSNQKTKTICKNVNTFLLDLTVTENFTFALSLVSHVSQSFVQEPLGSSWLIILQSEKNRQKLITRKLWKKNSKFKTHRTAETSRRYYGRAVVIEFQKMIFQTELLITFLFWFSQSTEN